MNHTDALNLLSQSNTGNELLSVLDTLDMSINETVNDTDNSLEWVEF
jgi:hypothetical protein